MNENIPVEVAKKLLSIDAIKLQPTNPFTWASGWRSPIYCDNRKTLSFPDIRSYLKNVLTVIIKTAHPDVNCIAGVATGAIALGALVADTLNLPFVYIRSAAKDHGLENLIEGTLPNNAKVVVIEDLISTGGSSIKAVNAVRNRGAEVLKLYAIFSYEFPVAKNAFKDANCPYTSLSNYEVLLPVAITQEVIHPDAIPVLMKWRLDPDNWTPPTE